MNVTMTSPFSTATPDSAMNPTPAEMEKSIPRRRRATIPPLRAQRHAAEDDQGVADGIEGAEQHDEDQEQADGDDDRQPLLGGAEVFELPAPFNVISLARRVASPATSTSRRASATNEPSRVR